MALDPRLHTPLFLGAFGLVFGLVGLWLVLDSLSAPADPIEAAPLVDARTLETYADGTLVLADGRVAASAPVLQDGLALVQRQVAQGVTRPGSNEVRFTWEPEATEPPAFDLELPGRAVRVRTADAEWRDPPRIVPAEAGLVTAGTKRAVGFAPSDTITVRAIVVRANGLVEFDAEELFGGSAAEYRASARTSHLVPLILGGVFALAGCAAVAGALVQAARVRRS